MTAVYGISYTVQNLSSWAILVNFNLSFTPQRFPTIAAILSASSDHGIYSLFYIDNFIFLLRQLDLLLLHLNSRLYFLKPQPQSHTGLRPQ